jgi:hypothetical protein
MHAHLALFTLIFVSCYRPSARICKKDHIRSPMRLLLRASRSSIVVQLIAPWLHMLATRAQLDRIPMPHADSLSAFGITRNFGSGNSGFQKCYLKFCPKFLIPDISSTRKFGFKYWVIRFTRFQCYKE